MLTCPPLSSARSLLSTTPNATAVDTRTDILEPAALHRPLSPSRANLHQIHPSVRTGFTGITPRHCSYRRTPSTRDQVRVQPGHFARGNTPSPAVYSTPANFYDTAFYGGPTVRTCGHSPRAGRTFTDRHMASRHAMRIRSRNAIGYICSRVGKVARSGVTIQIGSGEFTPANWAAEQLKEPVCAATIRSEQHVREIKNMF